MRKLLRNIDYIGVWLWVIRAGIVALIVWGSISTILDNPYTNRQWLDNIVSGLSQGSMYGLIAIGYTLVYGVLFMINFAHGEFFMSGIMTATIFLAGPLGESGFLARQPVLGLFIIGLAAVIVSVTVALVTERIAYRPLRKAPRLVPLITAIGASFFWQYFFSGLFGSNVKPFPVIPALAGKVPFLGTEILKTQLVVIIATIVFMVALNFFIIRTKTGKSIRALAEDKDVAALMGINVDRTISITFAVGAAMAGIAGLLFALVFRQVHFSMGVNLGIKAFTAAVLGGIGSIPGAAIGGLLLGMVESVGPSLFLEGLGIPSAHQLKDVLSFSVLVLILIFRPQGILGERLAEKKA